MPLHSEGEAVEEVAFDSGRALLRQVEASSSRAAMNISSPTGDRGKTVAEDGDESGSNIDLYYLIMIDEGLTQHEVRLEGGSRTITIPMDRDLLVNTEEVVPSLGPLYSDIEGETLKEINDSTLLKSIADLALTYLFLLAINCAESVPVRSVVSLVSSKFQNSCSSVE
nr:uncharacterized protein LOC117281865 [Nicotiana tomentosiformis]